VTARVSPDPSAFGGEAPAEFEYFLADHLPGGVSGQEGATEGEPPPQKYEEPIF
jgi:hypothetical protein